MRNLLYKITSFITLACASQFALALDCSKASNTIEINECASIEQKKVEAKLNAVYQRVMKMLDKEIAAGDLDKASKTTLIEAQRAWLKFREADCNAVYQYHISGTIRGVMYIGCMQTHTERRIKDLEEYEKN
ncbi:lysozyme inhibitor LprI family protein [Undibacterium sp. TS12]|uniref:lysozyme inhibitor LprI family protein n=1 Tax=Undibacterium sp. TS12 TaxID=2908202 RepID=UPI001F4D13EC|nr:lysozyme inhibitor LprI family protein [Undibacterium sp. TS12]MCH8622805.1 lysozyme inhibitor LprI family protein [Undibacterium sp. TS12]